jgi:hypothetical protein
MEALIYTLCTLTAFSCCFLLFRSYIKNRHSLLFWSGLCFAGLTANNFFIIVDQYIFPTTDLSTLRLLIGLISLLPLLYGLIWEDQ